MKTTNAYPKPRHSGESRNPGWWGTFWIPGAALPSVAFAGMTEKQLVLIDRNTP